MKFVILFAAILAVAVAATSPLHNEATVLKSASDVRADGFDWGYETSDGIKAQESGKLKSLGKDESAIVVTGSFSYTGDDGQNYAIKYTADENGFQPQGAHIPVA